MDLTRPTVIQTEHLDAAAAAWLGERVNLVVCRHDDPRFDAMLPTVDALVVRTYTQVDAALLNRAPRLKVVARAGVGVDNIDVAACAARGVIVVNAPDANTEAVVEYVFASMFDALRPREWLTEAVDGKRWGKLRETLEAPRQLDELTLGIVGLGRIGKRIAAVGAALGMKVIYNDLLNISAQQRHGARSVDRTTLLREADVLTIHVDGRPGNRGLISTGELAIMRDDVTIINSSRGFVLDPAALGAFLRSHPKAQARLDVHDPEPFGPGYPLLGLPNGHLSPHIAGRTRLAMARMSDVVHDVWRVLEGRQARHPVESPDG